MGFVWSKLWWWWLGLGRAVTEVCIVGVDGWLHEVNGDLNWKNGYMNCGICLLFSSFPFYFFLLLFFYLRDDFWGFFVCCENGSSIHALIDKLITRTDKKDELLNWRSHQ